MRNEGDQLLKYMQVITGNNAENCSLLLKTVINSDEKLREFMKDEVSLNGEVVESIKGFINKLSAGGCRQKEEKEALQVILTACTDGLGTTTNKNNVRRAIGISKGTFYGNNGVVPNSN